MDNENRNFEIFEQMNRDFTTNYPPHLFANDLIWRFGFVSRGLNRRCNRGSQWLKRLMLPLAGPLSKCCWFDMLKSGHERYENYAELVRYIAKPIWAKHHFWKFRIRVPSDINVLSTISWKLFFQASIWRKISFRTIYSIDLKIEEILF